MFSADSHSSLSLRLCVSVVLVLTIAVVVLTLTYLPWLDSFFILDDFSNLAGLGLIREYFDTSFVQYVLNGRAGPTGRPISMLTFAMQFRSWPDHPEAFKGVNLVIHSLNFLLIFFIACQLMRNLLSSLSTLQVLSVGFVSALIWALHPTHSTLVLYPVQRMALLSSFFILLSLSSYFLSIRYWSLHPLVGRLFFLFSTLCFPVFALFSKENGVLVYLYLSVVHYFIFYKKTKAEIVPLKWVGVFIYLPAFLFMAYILLGYSHWSNGYENRDFNLPERLMTQVRLTWVYIQAVIWIDPANYSVFAHDDILPSRGWLTPKTTVLALFSWVLICFILRFFRRHPLGVFSLFCILWFFVGHVLESSVVPLELYFDHRNYLSSFSIIWLVFVLVNHGVKHGVKNMLSNDKNLEIKTSKNEKIILDKKSIMDKKTMQLFLSVSLVILGVYGFLSKPIFNVWKSELMMGAAAVDQHPNSPRAYQFFAQAAKKNQQIELLDLIIKSAEKSVGLDNILIFHRINLDCAYEREILSIEKASKILSESKNTSRIYKSFKSLLALYENGRCKLIDFEYLLSLISVINENPITDSFNRYHGYLIEANLLSSAGRFKEALVKLDTAAELSQGTDSVIYYFQAYYSMLAGDIEKGLNYIEVARESLLKMDQFTADKEKKLDELESRLKLKLM